MEEKILKSLGLKQQFQNGIYEDRAGHFVIDLSDFTSSARSVLSVAFTQTRTRKTEQLI